MRAGLPVTMAFGGTSRVTTAPAPTIANAPTVIPGSIVALAPMLAPRLILTCRNCSGRCLLRGKGSLANVAFGPMNTSSSTRMPSHNWTPHLMVTRFPTTTSFSMKTWSQMLASSPITAPGSTWAKAQTRDPRPMRLVSTSA